MRIHQLNVLTTNSIQRGTISFRNSKTAVVQFEKPFTRKPSISLTLCDESRSVQYKQNVTKNKFTVRFKSRFTGDVDWMAME